MKLAMVGLGRMGCNMVRRLLGAGHQCVVFDIHPEAALDLTAKGAIAATSPADGSVIGSWLLDLTAAALQKNPELSRFSARVSDSGEGRWTLKAAIDEGVPAPVLSTALTERFASRDEEDFADKLLSALRYEFGGHEEKR